MGWATGRENGAPSRPHPFRKQPPLVTGLPRLDRADRLLHGQLSQQHMGHPWLGPASGLHAPVAAAWADMAGDARPITVHGTCSGAEGGSEWPWNPPAVTIGPQGAGGERCFRSVPEMEVQVGCRIGWWVSLGERAARQAAAAVRHQIPRNSTKFKANPCPSSPLAVSISGF